MDFEKLKNKIAPMTEREFLLYGAGVRGFFHLGETGVRGLHLIDATSEEVLEFVKRNG